MRAQSLLAVIVVAVWSVLSGARGQEPRVEIYTESYRPQFHFTSRTNWLNDPNGLVFSDGEYHLFFQHNPSGNQWGNMTWGHAVSRDLVHWKQLPNAINPDHLGTIFSGSAVVDSTGSTGFPAGSVVAMYTAAGGTSDASKGQPFTQCLAYSTDRGRTFTTYEHNPVLQHIRADNRDPKLVWYEPSRVWVLALFLDGDEYALFISPNMKQWKQIQTIHMPGCGECPDFFQMHVVGEPRVQKWVFTGANGNYLTGNFDGQTYVPDGQPQIADYGANFYAVQTYSDIPETDGRRIQIAWMRDGKYPGMPFNQQMSFPCELTLRRSRGSLKLFRWPVREIKALYRLTMHRAHFALAPGNNPLAGKAPAGNQLDITTEFEPGDAGTVGLKLCGATITYDTRQHTVTCLGRTSQLTPEKGAVSLRILVDRTSIELFGNQGEVSMSSCFLSNSEPGEMFAEGGAAVVKSLTIHQVASAWGQR